jgi:hypothetical protein
MLVTIGLPLKRIDIALFSSLPVFRGAWHLATAGAIFHRPIHRSAEKFILILFLILILTHSI